MKSKAPLAVIVVVVILILMIPMLVGKKKNKTLTPTPTAGVIETDATANKGEPANSKIEAASSPNAQGATQATGANGGQVVAPTENTQKSDSAAQNQNTVFKNTAIPSAEIPAPPVEQTLPLVKKEAVDEQKASIRAIQAGPKSVPESRTIETYKKEVESLAKQLKPGSKSIPDPASSSERQAKGDQEKVKGQIKIGSKSIAD